jgi:hypothetical protein
VEFAMHAYPFGLMHLAARVRSRGVRPVLAALTYDTFATAVGRALQR